MVLEICANSLNSAINAENGGADRIELCVNLEVGGLTPSKELIRTVKNRISIPVFVLIRPTADSFTYDNRTMKTMLRSIKACKELGCEGIVSGILSPSNQIDFEGTQRLIQAAYPLPFTFHRAFDHVIDPIKALQELINLGVTRLLTSGQKSTAVEGLDLLKKLKKQASNQIIIMPGGGIRSQNVLTFKQHGFSEIHSSALKNIDPSIMEVYEKQFSNDKIIDISDEDEIRSIKSLIKQ